MKKIMLLLALLAIIVSGCSAKDYHVVETAVKADMTGYTKLTDTDHYYVSVAAETMNTLLADKTSGVYYVGFSTCPWCSELVPVLNDVLKEQGWKAYYINVNDSSFSDVYNALSAFDATLPSADQSGGYVPFVIVIQRNGTIKTHLGTVDTHDAHERLMTEDEAAELKESLASLFS